MNFMIIVYCCLLLRLSVADNRVNKLFWCKQQGVPLASYVYFLEWFVCRKDDLEACNSPVLLRSLLGIWNTLVSLLYPLAQIHIKPGSLMGRKVSNTSLR